MTRAVPKPSGSLRQTLRQQQTSPTHRTEERLSVNPADLEAFRYEAALAIARQRKAQGQLDQAVSDYRRAASIAPSRLEAWREVGSMLHGAGRLQHARTVLEAALPIAPQDYELNFVLGNTLSALGDIANAERHYRAPVAARPDSAIAHNNLGYMLRLLGESDGAITSQPLLGGHHTCLGRRDRCERVVVANYAWRQLFACAVQCAQTFEPY